MKEHTRKKDLTEGKKDEEKPRHQQKGIELIASLRKKAEQLEKTRELVVWNRIKEEFKEVKSRSGGELFNPRSTLSRVEGLVPRPSRKAATRGV